MSCKLVWYFVVEGGGSMIPRIISFDRFENVSQFCCSWRDRDLNLSLDIFGPLIKGRDVDSFLCINVVSTLSGLPLSELISISLIR